MIKALFLIFEPMAAWEGIVRARRSLGFIVGFYLLPTLVIVAAAEGFGLVKWGKPQFNFGQMKRFTTGEATIYEAAQTLLTLAVIVVGAHLIKVLGETFRGRHTYPQAFAVAAYGLSPVFLLRLLDAFPSVNPWLTWIIGIMLTVKILYHGVPLVMLPDPPHAFGLYFMSSLLLLLLTGLERFITAWYLSGHFIPLETFVSHVAAKLPF
ncbi:MAG TPA: YIP1 family protein [Candidatus Aquilonibacter sp.]|nr:YIP1 family protein [Candidatus Aquilonibacter sp.]